MLKLSQFGELTELKKSLETKIPVVEKRANPKSGGFPDLGQHLPKSQIISGVYGMTPYVTEPRESTGEYLGCRWSPSPRYKNRTKKSYSIQ